ncbi:MAG: RNA-directed DNA polymerase [Chromatiaceae bacterium]|nr:RNA-directed DNA polymerase [Chromatiaceae bacterium]
MFGTDQTLLIRALNATRQSYFPTYVGLRLIAKQLPSVENSYLRRAVERRLSAGDRWRFRHFDYFKAIGQAAGQDVPEYRSCLAPSPFTAFAEALVLAQLASMPSFAAPARVYSYLWPKSEWSGSSYEFFADGYKRRNMDIAEALRRPGSVAVVTDLKGFYPSIQHDRVMFELKARLKSPGQREGLPIDAVENFYNQLFAAGGGGLPIGPASAHVLGHLALVDVDRELSAAYGAGYFRYVDDIIVVCDTADAAATKKRIADCVDSQGYLLNADKSVVMSAEEWNSSVLRLDVAGSDDFRRYTQDLAAYLVLHPDRGSELGRLLSEAGLSIPIQRLQALSSYSRFRYFLGRRKAPGGLPHALGMVFARNADFVERAVWLKQDYEQSLDGLVQDRSAKGPELRRWHVQRIRRVVNTLFYLRRLSEWKSNLGIFDSVPELVEQRSLAIALASGTVNPVLPFFPRGPAAFAELWSEHGKGPAAIDVATCLTTAAATDSLVTLSLTGTIFPEAVPVAGQGDSVRLLHVVKSRERLVRSNPDLSYEDEFESLSLGVSHEAISTLARTRYALSEGTILDALSLLSSEYRS